MSGDNEWRVEINRINSSGRETNEKARRYEGGVNRYVYAMFVAGER